ncbi:MAG: hypothetical protein Q9179_007002 [Wetmoreana sp. 5 TL-2023]
MAEALGISASIIAIVKTSRVVGNGISKLSSLRQAPDVLLALNNEVTDLQCVVEHLLDLERQYQDTLEDAITPTFRRAIERTNGALLDLENLIAYRLTKIDSQNGRLCVDRSSWLGVCHRIPQALQEIRDCRIMLSTAMNLLTSYESVFK